MKKIFKALFLVLLIMGFIACEKENLVVEETQPSLPYKAPRIWDLDVSQVPIDIVDGCSIDGAVVKILGIQYPGLTPRVFKTFVDNPDGTGFLPAAGVFDGSVLKGSIGYLSRFDPGAANGGEGTGHNSLFVCDESCRWAVGEQNRSGGFGRYYFSSDSADGFTAYVETERNVVTPVNVQIRKLVDRQTDLFPAIFHREWRGVDTVACKDQLQFIMPLQFDFLKIAKHLGAVTIDNEEMRTTRLELSANTDLGIFEVPGLDGYVLRKRNPDQRLEYATFGIAGDGSEIGWFGYVIGADGKQHLAWRVPITDEGGIPNPVWVTSKDGTTTRRFIVPALAPYALGEYRKMSLGGWLGCLLLLSMFFGTLKRRKELVLVLLFVFAGFGLQAQTIELKTDCGLSQSEQARLLGLVGVKPNAPEGCTGDCAIDWDGNKARLACLLYQLEQQGQINTKQAREIDSLRVLLMTPKGVPAPTEVKVDVSDHDTTIVNVTVNVQMPEPPKDTVKTDTIPPKPKRFYLGIGGGSGKGELHGSLPNPCNCPGIPIGYNEADKGLGFAAVFGLRPDYDKVVSLAGQLSGIWNGLAFEHGSKGDGLPGIAVLRFGAVATPNYRGIGVEIGPQLAAGYVPAANATWLGAQARLGAFWQYTSKGVIAIAANSNLASASWVGGAKAEKAHQWGLDASASYGVYRVFAEYQSLYAKLANTQGGAAADAFILGLGINF